MKHHRNSGLAPAGRSLPAPPVRKLGVAAKLGRIEGVGALALSLATSLLVNAGCTRTGDVSAPVPAPNLRETERVEMLKQRASEADADLVFLGDSLTAQWETNGREVWERYYGGRHALNLGVGWEQTENVLWRIEQGHLDLLRPRLIVLLVGTNDTEHGGDGPHEIADGVGAIVRELRERLPLARILLIGLFPRGRDRDDPHRANNEAVNALLAGLADGESVHYRDIGDVFLSEDGSISPEVVMPDYLHLGPRGYARWAEAIEGDITRLLADERS